MERVGFLGIIKLTTHIILKNFKHFLCIAILWQIPFSFLLPVVDLSSLALGMLTDISVSFYKLIVSKEKSPSPAALAPFPRQHFSVLNIVAGLLLSITISHPLLTFSVCRACLSKRLSLKGSLLGVPRSAKNLALASLCISAVVFGLFAMVLGMMAITVGVGIAVSGNESAIESLAKFCLLIAMGIGGVYVAISFSLVPSVAILEEKRGWGAMMRSMELLRGRKWLALGLVCLAYAIDKLCRFGVLYYWRWRGARIVRVSLCALVALFSMAAHVVLYVSCKREREEPLNTLIAASARFGPQESSPESMDVETAASLVSPSPN